MNIDKKKKTRAQAKRRFTRIGNNLQKSVEDDVILKTVESRYNYFKNAWKEVQRKHDEYMEDIAEQSDDGEGWISDLNLTFCDIEERTDAYIEKKIKENESEKKFEGEEKHAEELKIHRELEVIKLSEHIEEIQKLVHQTTDNKSDICEALKKGNKQLADRIASCERVNVKYVTLIKDHQERKEEKTRILPLINLYSKISSEIQVFISCNSK